LLLCVLLCRLLLRGRRRAAGTPKSFCAPCCMSRKAAMILRTLKSQGDHLAKNESLVGTGASVV
jgi:hypothetical protein